MPSWLSGAGKYITNTDTSTSIVITAPAGITVGDQLIALIEHGEFRTITAPSGFTKVRDGDFAALNDGHDIWVKTADSGDAGASTFTFSVASAGFQLGGTLHRCSDVDIATVPTSSYATSAATDPITCPTITTPVANCFMLWGLWFGVADLGTITTDKGTTRVQSNSGTNIGCVYDATDVIASAGSTTGATLTCGETHAKVLHSIAFQPLTTTPPDVPLPFRTMLTARGRR